MITTRKAVQKKQVAELKKFKSGQYEYIYIYYKYKGNILRINTGNKYTTYKMTKELLYNANEPLCKSLNADTLLLLEKVNSYIGSKMSTASNTVNQKECLKYINEGKYSRDFNGTLIRNNEFKSFLQPVEKSFMDYFNDFLQYKTKELHGNANSMSNYFSLQKNLNEFQTKTGTALSFEIVNTKEFIIDFKDFLNNYMIKGKFQMNANSVSSRLNYLKAFFNWLEDNDIITLKKSVRTFENKQLKTAKVSLSKQDLKRLQDLKDLKPKEQIVVDMFVCNSLMSLRFSDLIRLGSEHVKQHSTAEYYVQQTSLKTRTQVQIEIQPTSLQILQKYGFCFPDMQLKTFNRTLKQILKKHDLFSELITIQKRVGNEIKDVQIMRRDKISSHAMRRSFVNLAIQNNVPINTIMKSTGHRNINTIQSYIVAESNIQAYKGMDLTA